VHRSKKRRLMSELGQKRRRRSGLVGGLFPQYPRKRTSDAPLGNGRRASGLSLGAAELATFRLAASPDIAFNSRATEACRTEG
jgi:hypothetical protein